MFRFIIAALVAGSLTPAWGFPLPKTGSLENRPFPSTFTTDFGFEGIVALSNCSGSLIRLTNSADTDHAMVLTNGHCFEGGMPSPGEVISHQPSSRAFTVLNAAGSSLGRVRASEVIYSTMTKTDMTLYLLQETYAQIFSRYGVRPFLLADSHPVVGQPIEVVSGYWKRGFRCQVEFFVHELDEAGWAMRDSIRYSRPGCEVYGGTSGSPIIAAGTRTVIGVNNTGNENGGRCTMNNPCEIDESGNVTYQEGYSYGQQTYWIYSCLNPAGALDLAVPGCLLPH
jgi:V8-like Glu-specific endopeptidase